MSMSREEAIVVLEESKRQNEVMRDNPSTFWASHQMADGVKNSEKRIAALNLALAALRGPTRETVKRMFPGCEMCLGWNSLKLKPCANGDLGVQADIGSAGKEDPFGLVVYNHHLASGYVDFPFCPFCGKPKTDKAVDMMLERWKEALQDG